MRYSWRIMEHLILAVYVLLFASGFAGIAALVFLRMRVRSPLVSDFIGIQSGLLLGLALVLAYYYLGNMTAIGGRDVVLDFNPLAFVSNLVQSALYLFAARMTGKLRTGGNLRAPLRNAAGIVCLVVAASSLLRALRFPLETVLPRRATEVLSGFAGAGYILVSSALLLVAFCLLFAQLKGEHPAVVLLARLWAWSLFAFLPLTVLEWALDALDATPYKPLSLDFVFYFACNAASVMAFVRSLRVERQQGESVLAGPVPDETALRFALTDRERDMVPLIARGLANKEIAAELGISPATVRTHIYNLFQKAGARSRIELLNKLGG